MEFLVVAGIAALVGYAIYRKVRAPKNTGTGGSGGSGASPRPRLK